MSSNTMREIEKKKADHVIDVENKQLENTYTSCCFRMDRRFLEYSARLGISGTILIFAIVQISTMKDTCEPRFNLWSSLLTLVLGYWIPSPKMGN